VVLIIEVIMLITIGLSIQFSVAHLFFFIGERVCHKFLFKIGNIYQIQINSRMLIHFVTGTAKNLFSQLLVQRFYFRPLEVVIE